MAVVLVAGASLALEPILDRVPTAGLVAAVLLVAWFCGFAPAMVATGIAAALLAVAPPHDVEGHMAAHMTGTVLFVGVSTAVSWLVAARRRIERERVVLLRSEQAARAEAERLSRTKDDFLATVSHELRSPLTAILGWVQVLRQPSRDNGQRERAIETIARCALLQARLIDDLLDVSRMVEGKLHLSRRRLDVVALLHQAVDAHRPAACARDIRLTSTLPAQPLYLVADAQRLDQVVDNLLSNAIKFTPRDGGVTVRLERTAPWARIVVTDTGAGIDADVLPYIFERFHQGPPGVASGGLGLGLAIVKDLVTLHGGTVRAESAGTNRGATFVIELPC